MLNLWGGANAEGSGTYGPCEVIKNTVKMAQLHTNFHYTRGCKSAVRMHVGACTCTQKVMVDYFGWALT